MNNRSEESRNKRQMKPKVYIETTIISYLTGRPSRDIIIAAHQQITEEWWRTQRNLFDLYASQLVVREAGAGEEISWNCKHIANAKMRGKIEHVCLSCGYKPIIICTPEELMED